MTADEMGPKGPGSGVGISRDAGAEIGEESASILELSGEQLA